MSCDQIRGAFVYFARNQLPANAKAQFISHINQCPQCRTAYAHWVAQAKAAYAANAAANTNTAANVNTATNANTATNVNTANTNPNTATTPNVPPIEGQIGRYQIVEELNQEGVARVFKAKDANLDRLVAIKVVSEGTLSKQTVDRFVAGARAMAKLSHPNIAMVYDTGSDQGRHYFTADFTEGKSWDKFLKNKELNIHQILPVAVKIGRAVDYAHSQRIAHLDLNPNNIIINHNEPKVINFNIAKNLEELTEKEKEKIIPYMSPEQISRQGIDEKSDIYALGAILYQGLTKEVPGEQLSDITPAELENICLKALEKDKTQRYQTVKEFVAHLEEFLKNNKPKPVRKKNHKKKIPFIIAAIVLILVVVFLLQPTPAPEVYHGTKKLFSQKKTAKFLQKRTLTLKLPLSSYTTLFKLKGESISDIIEYAPAKPKKIAVQLKTFAKAECWFVITSGAKLSFDQKQEIEDYLILHYEQTKEKALVWKLYSMVVNSKPQLLAKVIIQKE